MRALTARAAPTTTIAATPCGRDRHGNPLAPRRYVVDARRENWGDGRTRVFEQRPDLEVGDGMLRFAPVVVRTESIHEYQAPHPAMLPAEKRVGELEPRRRYGIYPE